jgi:hypothetical protein
MVAETVLDKLQTQMMQDLRFSWQWSFKPWSSGFWQCQNPEDILKHNNVNVVTKNEIWSRLCSGHEKSLVIQGNIFCEVSRAQRGGHLELICSVIWKNEFYYPVIETGRNVSSYVSCRCVNWLNFTSQKGHSFTFHGTIRVRAQSILM